jgi:hypothetical protein
MRRMEAQMEKIEQTMKRTARDVDINWLMQLTEVM